MARCTQLMVLALLSTFLLGLLPCCQCNKCPPPEEKSLADKDCPRSKHKTQKALDECYMQIALDYALTIIAKHPIEVGHCTSWSLLPVIRGGSCCLFV